MSDGRFATDTRLQSVFQDGYGLEAEKLESLYSKSKRHQWNAESDVDWSRFEPDVDILERETDLLSRLDTVKALPDDQRGRLFRAIQLFTISQILHGEQAALMVCGQLVNAVPDIDGKFAAAVQVMDEARHVEVFARYLTRQGKLFPLDPDLQAIVHELLAESNWEAKCIGMQVILESIALSFFRRGEAMAVEPVFKQFIGMVHADEARHVAYGVLTLEERLPALSPAARAGLENWAYDAVARIAGRAGRLFFSSQTSALAWAGIDVASFLPKLMGELANMEHVDLEGIEDPIAQTVLPNLLRVGLVPDRLVPGYLAQGFRVDTDRGRVDDIGTFHPDARALQAEYQTRSLDFGDPTQAERL